MPSNLQCALTNVTSAEHTSFYMSHRDLEELDDCVEAAHITQHIELVLIHQANFYAIRTPKTRFYPVSQ